MADYIYLMESRLTPNQQRGVILVQDTARMHGLNVYLVGGAIRDIVSGSIIRDLDFAVQGNALKLQKDLEAASAAIEGSDPELRSMYVLLPRGVRASIISARSESYGKPGKPPHIEFATINEDLRRRDFTANAMALSLNPGSRGLLLDPFNGVADIEAKLLRPLHNYSFLEEPSRLIRATRFLARFHWTMDERTQARYAAAKENNYIEYVSARRLGHEIEQIAHEEDPLHIMKLMGKEGWNKVLHKHWSTSKVDVSRLSHLLKTRQQMLELGYSMDAAPAVMHFLTRRMTSADVAAMQKSISRKGFVEQWRKLDPEARELAKKLTGKAAATPSLTWRLLSETKPETILYLATVSNRKAVTQKIKKFFGKWRQVKQKLPFPEMAELRITPHLPDYAKLAEEAFYLLLDGKLHNHNEIVKFLTPYSPPEPPPPPAPTRRGRGRKVDMGAFQLKKEAQRSRIPADGMEPEAPAGEKPLKVKGRRGRKPSPQQERSPAEGLPKVREDKPFFPAIPSSLPTSRPPGNQPRQAKEREAKDNSVARRTRAAKSGVSLAGKKSGSAARKPSAAHKPASVRKLKSKAQRHKPKAKSKSKLKKTAGRRSVKASR